jgi:hypothetical protein
MAKKINMDEIDESFIIASVKKDRTAVPENAAQLLRPLPSTITKQPEEATQETMPPSEPPVKEELRRKRDRLQEYELLFIKETDLPPARFGKSVYIRKEFHDRISKIIHVIGNNEVSLFGYIDNVLAHHFDNFQDEITQSYKKSNLF